MRFNGQRDIIDDHRRKFVTEKTTSSLLSWRCLLLGVFASGLAACGGGEQPQAETETAPAPVSQAADEPAESAEEPASDSVVRSFGFGAIGVEPASELPKASDLTVTGGCAAPSPMSIGFTSGSPHEDGYFRFAIESAGPVAPGDLGAVELTRITWDNGVTTPANMPEDSPIKVPNRFEGAGTLQIDMHTGRGMAGRMSGTVTGEVATRAGDQTASLVVEFDINLACAG